MAKTISEMIGDQQTAFKVLSDSIFNNLRVAAPGIIQEFDPITQTVTVQVAIREKIRDENLEETWAALPLLLDVPIVVPRAGGFALTLPINKGDECLVVFSDNCIDAWFSNGGVQNQMEKRRHDLSDGFAIIGTWSQPNRIANYSTSDARLTHIESGNGIVLSSSKIDLIAPQVCINGIPIHP